MIGNGQVKMGKKCETFGVCRLANPVGEGGQGVRQSFKGGSRPSLFDCKRTGATPTTHTHTFTQEKKKSLRGERRRKKQQHKKPPKQQQQQQPPHDTHLAGRWTTKD
jgi:hypothetical protein